MISRLERQRLCVIRPVFARARFGDQDAVFACSWAASVLICAAVVFLIQSRDVTPQDLTSQWPSTFKSFLICLCSQVRGRAQGWGDPVQLKKASPDQISAAAVSTFHTGKSKITGSILICLITANTHKTGSFIILEHQNEIIPEQDSLLAECENKLWECC